MEGPQAARPLSAVCSKRRRASATQREAMRVKVRVTYHVERFFRTEGPRTSRNHKTHYLKKVAGIFTTLNECTLFTTLNECSGMRFHS